MRFKIVMIFCSLIIFLTGCNKVETPPLVGNEFVLGTVVQIKLYEGGSEEILEQSFARLKEIENHMTLNGADSEVIQVNLASGKNKVIVSEDTFYVIQKGLEYGILSNGTFDITIGPLVKLWGIGTDSAKVPPANRIEQAMTKVDFRKVVLDQSDHSVFLKESGMVIDLGGIAKGYAADEVVRILKEAHVKNAIINIGGNVFAYGKKSDALDWKIGIQNPFSNRGESVGFLNCADKTVVSSGIYERYFEEDGKSYHHIFDTQTGYPVDNTLAQTTIIANASVDADALSTILFTLGIEEGLALAKTLDDVQVIFVTKDHEIYCSEEIKKEFEITDSTFTLK